MKRAALILAAAIGFAALTGCAESALEAKIPDPSVNVTVSSSAGEVKEKSIPVPAATAKPTAKVEKTAVTDKPTAAPKPTKKPEEVAVPESTETKSTAAPESEATAETASVSPEVSSEPETPSSSRQVTVPNPAEVPAAVPTVNPAAVPTVKATATPTARPTAIPTAIPTTVPTPVPTAAPTSRPTPEPTAIPTPEPTEAPTPEPVPSGPYDYPFDVSAIRSDLIGVGQNMGLTHVTSMDGESLTPSNTSWSMPVTASQSFQGAALETSLKDYVRSMPGLIASYGGAPLQYFSIYVESLGGGSYCFYFLY